MATIYADFNAGTVDGRVRLSTVGSLKSLAESDAKPGDWVWLSDGELRVGGKLEEEEGRLVARPAWETLEDLPLEGEEPWDFPAASQQFSDLFKRPKAEIDYRRVCRLLPKLEPFLAELGPGHASFLRARAALSLNYPELALLAIEDAAREEPASPEIQFFRLIHLQMINQPRAFLAAQKLVEVPDPPALALAACVSVFAAQVTALQGIETRDLDRTILELARRIESAPGREDLPDSVVQFVSLARWAAGLELGEGESSSNVHSIAPHTEGDRVRLNSIDAAESAGFPWSLLPQLSPVPAA